MAPEMDLVGWQSRLDELARRHAVPGASLAVLADAEVTALATGVLHAGTGVEATTDSLFQIGSITKLYTATVLLRLVDQGLASEDTPVVEIVPEFRVADPQVSRGGALGALLSPPSGINGDFAHDTGRSVRCSTWPCRRRWSRQQSRRRATCGARAGGTSGAGRAWRRG